MQIEIKRSPRNQETGKHERDSLRERSIFLTRKHASQIGAVHRAVACAAPEGRHIHHRRHQQIAPQLATSICSNASKIARTPSYSSPWMHCRNQKDRAIAQPTRQKQRQRNRLVHRNVQAILTRARIFRKIEVGRFLIHLARPAAR